VTLREPGTEFEQRWEAFAGLTAWASGQFDGLLRDIADERAAPTLWCSGETGAVFAPYDGGIDLFLPDKGRVRELKGSTLPGCRPILTGSSPQGEAGQGPGQPSGWPRSITGWASTTPGGGAVM
jgi:hypothetical protein